MESKKAEIEFNFKPIGLAEQFSATITDLILEGKIESGKQLVESELQKQLGTSRSPIRESFRILETQGLVELIPRRGVFVKTETREDIAERFPVRASLEGLAAREALGRISARNLRKMKTELRKMEVSLKKNNIKAYKEAHFEFHELFIRSSKNRLLIDMLKPLRLKGKWSNYSQQYFREDYHEILKIHQTILKIFEQKNTETQRAKIESIVRNHIELAGLEYLQYFDSQDTGNSISKDNKKDN